MTDYPEAVREWEEMDQHGGLPYEPNDVWRLADAAIAALQDQRMQLMADVGTLQYLLEVSEGEERKWKADFRAMETVAKDTEAERDDLLKQVERLKWMLDTACEDMASVGASERHFFAETAIGVLADLAARYEAEHDDIGIYDAQDLRGRDE